MKYILLGFSILLFSCHSGKPEKDNMNSNKVDISMDTWILDNQELKSILSDYINKAKSEMRDGNFIGIYYKAIDDTTNRYFFVVEFDINALLVFPPHLLFQFEQQLVSLHIEGLDIFKMNDDFIVEFMKQNFPEQYDYFLEVGEYPMPTTGGCLTWVLVFQNDLLISKEEFITQ